MVFQTPNMQERSSKMAHHRYRKGIVRKMQSVISLLLYISRRGTQRQKGTSKIRYIKLTPAGYRYFTVIKVTPQVVNHCILSGQTPQDAVGGHFGKVYKEIVTIACSRKVRNMAMHSKCVLIIINLITCIIFLQSVPSVGKIKCLQFRSCHHVNMP